MTRQIVFDWLECLSRFLLGGLFVYSAWGKIGDPGIFANTVMRYELLPEFMVGMFALTLPMVELLSGLALMFTKWTREAALIVVAMLVMFIVALGWAVANGLEIDCGCFGVPSVGGRTELLLAIGRDLVLLLPAVWLLFRRNAWIGLRGIALIVAATLISGIVAFAASRPKPAAPAEIQGKTEKDRTAVRKAKSRSGKERRNSTRRIVKTQAGNWSVEEADGDDDDDLSPEDRKLMDAIEDARDRDDLAALRSLSAKALNAGSTEVREEMVDALGYFGVKALPELTPFLADADEDVRESAMNEWSIAVAAIEDEEEKLGIVELAMNVLSNEDSLETISGEYIGADEKLAVESLLRIIEADGSKEGIDKAKETYEFVTGEEFTNRADAEKWIAEEYEPPEQEK